MFHSSHRWFVGVLGSSRLRIGGRRSVDFWSQLPFFGSRFHGQMGTGEGGGRIGEEQLATKGRIERRKRGKVQMSSGNETERGGAVRGASCK